MKVSIFIGFALFFAACNSKPADNKIVSLQPAPSSPTSNTTANNNQILDAQSIAGTYLEGEAGDEENGFQELKISALANGKVKFELTLYNGGHGGHSGFADGELELKNNQMVWETKEYVNPCRIVFSFNAQEVSISQEQGGDIDCGFGAGVMAGGILKKVK